VVPLAKADTFPYATPQRAVPVFWLIAALNLLAATLLGFTAIRATDRSRLSTSVFGILAFLVFLLACGLTGPAYGYREHGPAMQTTSILLIFCSAAEFLAAVLLSTTAFLLPELSERRTAPVT
jgi:hypothetical protein